MSLLGGDGEDVDGTFGGTAEEAVTISGPLDGSAPRKARLDGGLVFLDWGLNVGKDFLVLQIPNLNGGIGSGTQPVVLRREAHGGDDGTGIEGVQVLSFVDIPEHSGTVLTTGSTERSIRRDGDGVDNFGVSCQVGLESTVVQVPDLDELIPTTRDNERVLGGRRESDTGDPVSVTLLDHGVLALSKSVPQLDRLITGSGNNLSVIRRERDRVDILGVALKSTDAGSVVQIPKTHGGIHGTGQTELTIRRDNGITDTLVVSLKRTTSVTNWLLLVGHTLWRGELPHDGGLITGSGDDQVALLVGGGDGGDPITMTVKGPEVRDCC